MAETALAGKGGTLYLPGTPTVPVANIRQWDLTVTADNYDASVLGDTWRHFVHGLQGWNGTITGYYDLVNDTTGQLVIFDALVGAGFVVLVMQTSPGGGQFEGTAVITQAAVSDPVDNLISLNFTFVGTGSLQHLP